MTVYEYDPNRAALTPAQQRQYDRVRTRGARDGRDLADVLAEMDMPTRTRDAVGDALGGPGAGFKAAEDRAAYLRGEYVPADQRTAHDEVEA